ncbi:dihydrofolate reductase-like domain-containing protein [Scenedesmus sp. NREL 46B-D3]|nr:dihydrofolate reductase-like domain-containing protein [Scenedesmus sp. NREL 46B-D3]
MQVVTPTCLPSSQGRLLQLKCVTAPHPNAACVLVSPNGQVVGSACHRAQGTTPSEVLAVQQAREAARGATAYLNLETGDCHGDESAVAALVGAGVSRVVVGLRHPLPHLRNKAISAFAAAGLDVSVLGQAQLHASAAQHDAEAALRACLVANEPLLHRAVLKKPLSVLKYAMTLDGKIATAAGHSAWVSSPQSRAVVFDQRAASDAVVVGGNTVRRDNPRLTTRREGGHLPVRVVMSRTLDLPHHANLWDTEAAPTIVMTQRGARQGFQAHLRSRGVEVMEFDFLTPDNVADYCYQRGFLQVFWECGGTLAAPAISGGVIHKVLAFIAPKIIGGERAPTPVGELGNVEMTQAVSLLEPAWKQVGPDLMMTGYLPSSGGLSALEQALSFPGGRAVAAAAAGLGSTGIQQQQQQQHATQQLLQEQQSGALLLQEQQQQQRNRADSQRVISFYKAWDEWGALSNFSPHPIRMPSGALGSNSSSSSSSSWREYASVEHYYQSQKFAGVDHADAVALVESISAALSPEEAAQLGRRVERERPELVRPDWADAKRSVMLAALRVKFSSHAGPGAMLLSTAGSSSSSSSVTSAGAWGGIGGEGGAVLVESSPHDRYWGQGYDGSGQNHLGLLLMQVRQELLQQQQQQQQQGQQQQQQQHHAVNGAGGKANLDSSSWARDLRQPRAG